jgi:dephospho-CoA kinase
MRIAGITGGIGSGKSTVARMFARLGAEVIDADELARIVVDPGKRAWREIREAFGEGVLNDDQTINREALSEVVFKDSDARGRLEKITHPRIGEEIIRQLQEFRDKGVGLALIDAALLVESPATRWIRPVILVTAPEDERVRRTRERSALSEDEIRSRIRAQATDEERKSRADYVIDNSGGLEDLEGQVRELWDILSGQGRD